MPVPWLQLIDAALGLANFARGRRAPAANQDQRLEVGGGGAGGLDARLPAVVVAALKEVFDRDSRRLQLEREQLEAEQERAARAMQLELLRQAGDREIGRLRLLAGIAVVSWFGTLFFSARLIGGGTGPARRARRRMAAAARGDRGLVHGAVARRGRARPAHADARRDAAPQRHLVGRVGRPRALAHRLRPRARCRGGVDRVNSRSDVGAELARAGPPRVGPRRWRPNGLRYGRQPLMGDRVFWKQHAGRKRPPRIDRALDRAHLLHALASVEFEQQLLFHRVASDAVLGER